MGNKIKELGLEKEVLTQKGKGLDNKSIADSVNNNYKSQITTKDVADFLYEYNNIVNTEKLEGKYKEKLIKDGESVVKQIDEVIDILLQKIRKYHEDGKFVQEKEIPKFAIVLQKYFESKSKLVGEDKENEDLSVKFSKDMDTFFTKKKKKKDAVEQ